MSMTVVVRLLPLLLTVEFSGGQGRDDVPMSWETDASREYSCSCALLVSRLMAFVSSRYRLS